MPGPVTTSFSMPFSTIHWATEKVVTLYTALNGLHTEAKAQKSADAHGLGYILSQDNRLTHALTHQATHSLSAD